MKESKDLLDVGDADLDVVEGSQSGSLVKWNALDEKGADGVEGGMAIVLTHPVESLEDCMVEKPGVQVRTFVPRNIHTRCLARFEVGIVSRGDQLQVGCVDQVKAIAHIDDGTDNGRIANFSGLSLGRFGPKLCA